MALPALDRGILLVETVLLTQGPLRYRELKDAVEGVGDASFNRLLTALVDNGSIARTRDGHYTRGSRLERWRSELGARMTVDAFIETELEALSQATRESVAYGRLVDNTIRIVHSVSCRDSITVIEPGGILHFESDHAGALAVLGQLDARRRKAAVASPRSAIATVGQLEQALEQSRKGEVYLDRSRARVGVSRMATAVHDPNGPSALFYCLPTERMYAREERLTRELLKTAHAMEVRLGRPDHGSRGP
ncbi:MAG: hypothetical protein GF331_11425 [Chitinivibrionales bacterium]|nr:hypothetical protein [Chitinivibrionales bacterium]